MKKQDKLALIYIAGVLISTVVMTKYGIWWSVPLYIASILAAVNAVSVGEE